MRSHAYHVPSTPDVWVRMSSYIAYIAHGELFDDGNVPSLGIQLPPSIVAILTPQFQNPSFPRHIPLAL